MSIHKSASGKYVVRYREGGKHRGKSFTREADAARFEADVIRRRELGEQILSRRDVPTLEQEAKAWLASKQGLSPHTEALYADRLRLQVLPDLGGMKLVDLRPRALDAWQSKLLRKGTSARTVQQARMVLSQVLTRAVAHEYLPANPLSAIPAPAYSPEDAEPATVAQVEAMRAYFLERERRMDALLISLLAYTGIRPPQESHGLMWSDVEARFLRLRRRNVYGKITPRLKKNRRERMVELPGPVALELSEARIRMGRPTGLVFCKRSGQPLTKSDYGNWRRRHFDKAREAASLPESFVPYHLRHTAASLMVAAGRPVTEIAEQLGHSLQVSVTTYQHLIESMRGSEIVPLDQLIAEARSSDVHSDVG